MARSDLNRRTFLKYSTTAATVAGISATAAGIDAAESAAEVRRWKRRIGARYSIEGAALTLRSVDVTDHSADRARPRNVRPQSIALLFAVKSGSTNQAANHVLTTGTQELSLHRVVAPRGERGEFLEAILN